MARIALVNAPFRSHVMAMLRLAGVLARQGHSLVVWAPEEWRSQVEQLGARLEESAPDMPRDHGAALAAALASTTERETERLIPKLHAHDVDLVIRDSQASWALVAAKYLGIPRIVSHPMFPMLGAQATEGAGDTPLQSDAERERFEQSWLSIARRWGVELSDVRGLFHRTPEPTLTFTTEEILGKQVLPPSWRCIGPLLPPPQPPRPERSSPLVYASFGTAQNRRTELFRIVISAMARKPVRLVVSGGGRSLTPDELGPLPSNVIVHDFVSPPDVLVRASVHITHGGCNSVHESLMAGVPMVCLPQAWDQIPLSRRVEQLGVGVIAEQDSEGVAEAVLRLLDDSEARLRVHEMSGRLQRYDGETRVAEAIADCL